MLDCIMMMRRLLLDHGDCYLFCSDAQNQKLLCMLS